MSRFSSVSTIAVRLSNSSLGRDLSISATCLTCTMLDAHAATLKLLSIVAKLSWLICSVAGNFARLLLRNVPASWLGLAT